MAASSRHAALTRAPVWGAAAAGAAVALLCLALPAAALGSAIEFSGVGAFAPAATPPQAPVGRAVLALAAGAATAAIVWAALYLLVAPRRAPARPIIVDWDGPAVRRADAHPDAPPRRPLSAAELATPTPPAERSVPADLDTPLAALDPAAIPATPREPVRAVASLAPGERLRTFSLAPAARAPQPAGEPPSIEALLRRLEASADRVARAG